jgi:N-acetylgalactosamine-N,N'-diacetylbacillosaminyl-diphospho-undecaprenol 4-alpha-N-acetylgalactosaminyltransferase
MFNMQFLAKKLRKYLEKNKIDTLFSLLSRPNIISCHVKKMGWPGKVIISERVDTLAYYKTLRLGFVMLWFVKKFYPYADQVTVISAGIAVSLRKLGIKECKVIYNPVHLTGLTYESLVNKDPVFTYINVARFEEQKNHKLLLEAFARVKNTDSRLLLLGKGVLQPALEDLASGLNIRDRVDFAGFNPNVNEILQKCHCFVFSSDYEGLGNVIIEALNNGVPVVSTDCPHGPREILDPGNFGKVVTDEIDLAEYGILVPVKRADLLAQAMDLIYTDAAMREKYAKLSLERVRDFDIKKISREYFDIF